MSNITDGFETRIDQPLRDDHPLESTQVVCDTVGPPVPRELEQDAVNESCSIRSSHSCVSGAEECSSRGHGVDDSSSGESEVDDFPPDAKLSDSQLEVVELPLADWRSATGLVNLDIDSIKRHYIGDDKGVRDFDAGKWYKILSPDSASASSTAPRLWDLNEIQVWMQVSARMGNRAAIAKADAGYGKAECLLARKEALQKRWSEYCDRIPAEHHEGLLQILLEPPA